MGSPGLAARCDIVRFLRLVIFQLPLVLIIFPQNHTVGLRARYFRWCSKAYKTENLTIAISMLVECFAVDAEFDDAIRLEAADDDLVVQAALLAFFLLFQADDIFLINR